MTNITNDSPTAADAANTDVKPQDTAPATTQISEPAQPAAPAADAKEDSQPVSSGAGDNKDANKKPTSLLDAVKSAARKPADAASSTVATNGASAKDASTPQPGQDDTAEDKSKPEADQKLPFHNHPRWKEMVKERDSFRSDADQFRKITGFMQSNGLTQEEVVDGFKIMALMKTNPAEAYKRIKGYADELAKYSGEIIPDDLKKEVEEGFIAEDKARRLAALEAEKKLRDDRDAAVAQQREAATRKSIYDSVVNWEQQQKAKDPDWSAKQELVNDQVRLMLQSEQPSTQEEAIALVERAHSIIKERLARFVPQRKPLTTVTSASSSASASPAAPRSLEEAIRFGAMATR